MTLAKVDKLQQTKKEANHKLRNLRQQLARQNVERPTILDDLTYIDGEEERSPDDMREELDILKLKTSKEDERLRRLVHGSGKGRPKSAEFELASRTILATGVHFPNPYINPILINTLTYAHLGCSARAARDQIVVAGQLFLNQEKFEEFEKEVPTERWFRSQRKGLGYEAWLYAMQRVARSEEILQWGFDETSLDGTPTLNQWVLLQDGLVGPSVITIECCGLLVGSTAEEIADHVRASWLTGETLILNQYPNLMYPNLVPHVN
jgi:hypothetical protein